MNILIRRTACVMTALCCLSSTQCLMASSVTVVTHGFDPWADLFPGAAGGPLRDLGLALYNYWSVQPGGAVEYQYDPSYQGLTWLRGAAANDNKIIVFDWSLDSNDPQAGYDEGAGDVMFAMLRQYDLLNSDYLHLIGHSRGGVVSTQAARRILHYGYDVDQLTLLDVEEGPYPYNEAGPGRAWEGIGFVDNYYGDGEVVFLDVGLGGNHIDGAYNLYKNKGHGSFPEWYAETVSDPDVTKGGFYWRVANPVDRPAATGSRAPLFPPPDVINGNFSYGISVNDKVAGWWYHGGGGGGHVDLITLEDFDLELDNGDTSKRHSWLYAPEDVYKLEFQAQIGGSWLNDDIFRITLERYDNYSRSVIPFSVDDSAPWRWYSIDISDFANSVFRFTFAIEAPGVFNVVDSQVEIDNVRFLLYSAADFNHDGIIDAADYVVWRKGLGTIYTPDDYAVWRANFGQHAGSGAHVAFDSSSRQDAPIPEPATCSLLLAALRWLAPRRRRGRLPGNSALVD